MPTPRLWSWNLSPFAGRARIAFAEKGVPVDLVEIHPVKRPARLKELNPTNRVPVLEVGDVAVRESSAICEWLEDTHPENPFWPADAAERARARGLMRWVDDELTVNFFLGMRKQAFGPDEHDPENIVDVLHARLPRRWEQLEPLLGQTDGPWLMGGDRPTLADLSGMALAVRVAAWKPELAPDAAKTPLVAAWLDALRSRESAAEVDRKGEPVEG